MGGSDRPTHIFRQGDKPGLFVLAVSVVLLCMHAPVTESVFSFQVVPGGVAEKCGRIKCGDRILAVIKLDIYFKM